MLQRKFDSHNFLITRIDLFSMYIFEPAALFQETRNRFRFEANFMNVFLWQNEYVFQLFQSRSVFQLLTATVNHIALSWDMIVHTLVAMPIFLLHRKYFLEPQLCPSFNLLTPGLFWSLVVQPRACLLEGWHTSTWTSCLLSVLFLHSVNQCQMLWNAVNQYVNPALFSF